MVSHNKILSHGARRASAAFPFRALRDLLFNLPLALILFAALLLFSIAARAEFLDQTTYFLTTNSASQSVTVTNWPASGSSSFEWYPSAVLFNNNQNATTGVLLRVDLVRPRTGAIMTTNLTFTTNTLFTHAAAEAVSTNYVFPGRFYVVPPNDKLVITSVSTNSEFVLIREVAR